MAQEIPSWNEISRSDLKIFRDKLIGVGSYGEVYEGRCRGQDVAVKLLKPNSSAEDTACFTREIEIMSCIRHPHIVLFMGAITIIPDQLQIVMELLESGLDEVLQNPNRQLTLLQCFQIAFECASGINWLHCMKPYPIIHRDIRCPNFLIDESLRVKVCDFGLSVFKTEELISLALPDEIHSPAYLAPEIFLGTGFDEKCDVFSYGVTLWEILTRLEAYTDQPYPNPRTLLEAVCREKNPLRPSLQTLAPEIPNQLRNLMVSCWDADRKRRPAFSEILDELREAIDSFAILAPSAREFWEENFGKKTKVLWSQFQSLFVQYLRLPSLKANFCACLQYLLARGTDEVTMSHFGELIDYFGPLNKRYGDNHFYNTLSQTVKQSWFFGNMGPTEAAARLLEAPVGSFLVRFSSSVRGNFVITAKQETEIVHLPIQHAPLGSSYQIEDRAYPSLETLIDQETDRLHLNYSCPGSIFSLLMSTRHDSLSLSFSCSNILKQTPSPARREFKVKKTDLT